MKQSLTTHIKQSVAIALLEDLAEHQDITSLLIPEKTIVKAQIITLEDAIVCGQEWVNELFRQLSDKIAVNWRCKDGDFIATNAVLCELTGNARILLTGERTALNFLQTLSGIATTTHRYFQQIEDTQTKLLDTRKTIPGLRLAEKYAVRCGGGTNHRMGLYDAFLIKENHIIANGSISKSIAQARRIDGDKNVEVEVENLEQLQEAIEAKADIIMLDNFTIDDIHKAVKLNQRRIRLEVSGDVTLNNIRAIAKTGIDFISVGALTKNIRAINLSMRV